MTIPARVCIETYLWCISLYNYLSQFPYRLFHIFPVERIEFERLVVVVALDAFDACVSYDGECFHFLDTLRSDIDINFLAVCNDEFDQRFVLRFLRDAPRHRVVELHHVGRNVFEYGQ